MNAPAAPRTFKKKKAITVSTLKFEVDKPLFVLIMEAIHLGKERGKQRLDSEGKPQKPPTVARVVDLSTGEECQIILAEVLKTELTEAYSNDSYIGLAFEMMKQKRKEGKRYDPYSLSEVELPPEFQKVADSAKADAAKKSASSEPVKETVSPSKAASAGK